MTVTKAMGWILILFALIYLLISLTDFGPEYAAAGAIGSKANDYGLQTTATNLRFQMGWEFAIDILFIGLIALAGWWLTTQEVLQLAWIIIIGLFVVFSAIIRATPVLPLNVAKYSPGAAFYGAKIQVAISADVADQYVVIRSEQQRYRTAVSQTPQGQPGGMVVLDLGDSSAAQQYQSCTLPLTVTGTVRGTASIAQGRELTTVPLIRVQTAQSGTVTR